MKTQCQRSGDIPVPIDAKAGSWKTPVRVIEADGWERAGPSNDSAQPWRQVQLGELLREPLRNGHSAKETNDPNGIRTLTLTAVTKRDFSLENTKITCADPKRVQDMWLKPGDILIERANTPEYVGLAALYEGPENFAIFPDLMIRVRIDEQRADTKFIAYKLLSEESRRYFRAHARSTAGNFPKIDQGTIESVPIDLPPLPEQKKIAHILSTVQRAIEAQERIIQTTTELKKALMHKLFTEGLRGEPQKQTEIGPIPESWEVVPLSSCAVVQTGIAKGRKIDPKDAIELPYLRVANVQDGYLDLTEMKTITIRKDEERRYALQEGDVVLTEGGDFDKLGRGFIWHGQIDRCVHQNHVFAVRPDTERISSEFFAYQSQSPYGKAYFLSVAHKTTNLACINTTKLKAFPVLLPSREEQRDIVDACQSIDGKISSARAKHSALQDLFRTLLHELMTAKTRVQELEMSC